MPLPGATRPRWPLPLQYNFVRLSLDPTRVLRRNTYERSLVEFKKGRQGSKWDGPRKMRRHTNQKIPRRVLIPKTATSIRRIGTVLLDQQMWCWGRDVLRQGGNALCAYGFERHPPPAGLKAGSCYQITCQTGEQVALWGFGLFFGKGGHGGLFLRRYEFNPVFLRVSRLPEAVWGPDSLSSFHQQSDAHEEQVWLYLLPAALRWMAGYERWVQQALGLEYREECVAEWHKQRIAAQRMADTWDDLARKVVEVRSGSKVN
jgi:hypothetical protein